MDPMAPLTALLLAVAGAAQEQDDPAPKRSAPPPIEKLKGNEPDYEVQLPRGYLRLVDDSVKRFKHRFRREAGVQAWSWIRAVVQARDGVPTLEVFTNPAFLTDLTAAPERTSVPVTNVTTKSATETRDRFRLQRYEIRFDQDLQFVALAAVYEIYPRSLTVAVVAPADPELEEMARRDLDAILVALDLEYSYLTPGELESREGQAKAVMYAALGLSALYPLCWALFFRGHQERAHWVRVLWLTGAAFAWVATGIVSYPMVETMRIMEAPVPLPYYFFVWIPAAGVFGTAGLIRTLRPRSAWTWT